MSNEPSSKKSSCAYCGDASVNHRATYIESLISLVFDNYTSKVVQHAPKILKDFANVFPEYLFRTFIFLRLATFSSDIEKANSFRSRVIWEEAKRRGIPMEQILFMGKPLDQYRAIVNGKKIYFDSIPIPNKYLDFTQNWDDKIVLKKELMKHDIPVPSHFQLSIFNFDSLESIFAKLQKPVILKPRIGSRGRHTITNIHNLDSFIKGVGIVRQISSYISIEEHLDGYICRATVVNGVLAGFYRACPPYVIGDGVKTIKELIEEKDANRHERIQPVHVSEELHNQIAQSGFKIGDVLPEGSRLFLSHRGGRLFGGSTREMIDELHPSFVPILEKAGKLVGLAVAGFDCIIPDPTKDQASQRWGIIECNTLPFIDLHYYALEGKPRNIAGMVWDMWK